VLTRAPGAHTLQKHGGSVTNEQLEHRARTGVAPDGSIAPLKKNGNIPIPPFATAFHSDEDALRAEAAVRQSGALHRAIEDQKDAEVVRLPATEVGFDTGRGFARIDSQTPPGAPPTAQGPLQFYPAITRVRGYYLRDPSTGEYYPTTLFPDPVK